MRHRLDRLLAALPWKRLVVLAASVLLYYMVGHFIRLPGLFGLHLEFQYAVLGLAAVVYGPLMGLAVGALGELALGLAGAGVWWSLAAAAALAGFGTGLICHERFRRQGFAGTLGLYLAASLLAHAVAWVVVCPALDMLFYREALDNLILRGLLTALANALMAGVVGTLLLVFLSGLLPWQREEDRGRQAAQGAGERGENHGYR